MNRLSVSVIVMAGITFYAGIYHLLMFIQRRRLHREDLVFAVMCFVMGSYAAFSGYLYSAPEIEVGMRLHQARVAALGMVDFSLLWFVIVYIEHKPRKWEYAIWGYFLLALLGGIVDGRGLFWHMDEPVMQTIRAFGISVTYYEARSGFLIKLQTVLGGAVLLYAAWLALRFYRSGNKERGVPLLLALSIYFAGGLNDMLVNSGVYVFMYLLEYAYIAIILLMAYSVSKYVAKSAIADELAQINQRLRAEIAERERARGALNQSLSMLQATLDSTTDGILVVDQAGKIVSFNERFKEIWRLPEDSLHVDKDALTFVREQLRDPDAFAHRVAAVYSQPEEESYDVLHFKDGRILERYSRPQRIGPRIVGRVWSFREVTEQRKAEATVKETARLYQQRSRQLALLNDIGGQIAAVLDLDDILDTVPRLVQTQFGYHHVAIFTLDRDAGVLKMRSLYGAYADLYPPGHQLKLGQGVVGWVGSHRQRRLANDVDADHLYVNLYPEVVTSRSELCVPILLGEELLGALDVQSPQRDAFDDNDVLVLESVADQIAIAIENARLYDAVQSELADRMRAEAELVEAQVALEAERASLAQRVAERTAELSAANAELARAARLKDEFLAAMSHELRTPLNAILTLSEMLREQLYGALNERQLRYVSRIEESGQHLLALIRDILDVAKIGAGKLTLTLDTVVVEDVCRASVALVIEQATAKNLELSLDIDKAADRMQADERRLKQILVNLLSNAVKFTPDGGRIGLEVLGDRCGSLVRFTVWDTGIGISRENMKHLFQSFVQLDSRLSRQYEGTGLGLTLAYKLTEMHGGSISVESEEGVGSRFTVALPWNVTLPTQEPAHAEAQANSENPADKSPLILLAEDNEITLSAFSDHLTHLGYAVMAARDGLEVMRLVSERSPDLMLMDIRMPNMDGLETIRRIRENFELSDVPIIAITALEMPGDRESCLDAGANIFLRKPISLRKLTQTITHFI